MNEIMEYIENLTSEVNLSLSSSEKKEKGQYFTSSSIATFITSNVNIKKDKLRVLDPGSGLGALSGALIQRIITQRIRVDIDLVLYEKDKKVTPHLRSVMELCKKKMHECGNEFEYTILEEDFILDNRLTVENDLFNESLNYEKYDVIISNPPYYKVKKDHVYSRILADYIHGQPNVYFMFMIIASKLLINEGQLIFITPRSYCSGAYFERFRTKFFDYIDPDHFHLFNKRKGNFKGESVLQESIILSGFKRDRRPLFITISSSDDLNIIDSYQHHSFEKELIIDSSDQINLIRLPVNEEDEEILHMFDSWNNNLTLMDMEISTGRVVTFRNKDNIEEYNPKRNHPLIFMQHLKNQKVHFPSDNGKDLGVKDSGHNVLVPSKNYVLLKRFTSKEQTKRIVCASYLKKHYDYKFLGIENHLNYIHKYNDDLSEEEAMGICAFLNSSYVDKFFRIINGNTQVNASDIRPLPFPNYEFILEIGRKILEEEIKYSDIDSLIKETYEGEKMEKADISEKGNKNKEQQAIQALKDLGLPVKQQNTRSALTLLALLGVKEEDSWEDAGKYHLRIVDIMEFMANQYGKVYAPNSRETIRRQTIHQFEQARIIDRNPDDPTRPTNSGNTVYAVTDEFLHLIKSYNTEKWAENLSVFKNQFSTLTDRYKKTKEIHRVPVKVSRNNTLYMSSGEHNVLQKHIIEDFAAIFAPGSELLYVGDTSNKKLYLDEQRMEQLNIPTLLHDKLPDVVLYSQSKDWIYLIEAVTSHGPISNKRVYELEKILENCKSGRIYVTAFPDMSVFKKYATDIAWETEVWFADNPEHMMHLNGDRFFGPRNNN
ncbi:BsuBI/PstI family type II restriction endonuclease [Bacillus sp. FSL P2-0092]|uniref:BsuBI/PstI family type II restriction endonuclease n=1 Tax=Bacillus sp. FSL P2-0092 TaxID=2921571 RepID=UPI0030F5010D